MTRIPLSLVVLWQAQNLPGERTTFTGGAGCALALLPDLGAVEIVLTGAPPTLVPFVDCRRVVLQAEATKETPGEPSAVGRGAQPRARARP